MWSWNALLLVVLVLPVAAQGAADDQSQDQRSRISHLNVLLPPDAGQKLKVSGGCFQWDEPDEEVARLNASDGDEYRDAARCWRSARVEAQRISSRSSGNSTMIVARGLGNDGSEKEKVLRCKVTVAAVKSLKAVTSTKTIGLECQVDLSVDGLDAAGNTFTSVEGLRFDWAVSEPKRWTDGAEAAGRVLDLCGLQSGCVEPGQERLKGNRIVSPVRKRLEAEGGVVSTSRLDKHSDVVVIAGHHTGVAGVTVTYRSDGVKPSPVQLAVVQQLRLRVNDTWQDKVPSGQQQAKKEPWTDPPCHRNFSTAVPDAARFGSRLTVPPNSCFALHLCTPHKCDAGRLKKLSLAKKPAEFLWSSDNAAAVSVDRLFGSVTAVSVGHSTVTVSDQMKLLQEHGFEKNEAVVKITVAHPKELSLGLLVPNARNGNEIRPFASCGDKECRRQSDQRGDGVPCICTRHGGPPRGVDSDGKPYERASDNPGADDNRKEVWYLKEGEKYHIVSHLWKERRNEGKPMYMPSNCFATPGITAGRDVLVQENICTKDSVFVKSLRCCSKDAGKSCTKDSGQSAGHHTLFARAQTTGRATLQAKFSGASPVNPLVPDKDSLRVSALQLRGGRLEYHAGEKRLAEHPCWQSSDHEGCTGEAKQCVKTFERTVRAQDGQSAMLDVAIKLMPSEEEKNCVDALKQDGALRQKVANLQVALRDTDGDGVSDVAECVRSDATFDPDATCPCPEACGVSESAKIGTTDGHPNAQFSPLPASQGLNLSAVQQVKVVEQLSLPGLNHFTFQDGEESVPAPAPCPMYNTRATCTAKGHKCTWTKAGTCTVPPPLRLPWLENAESKPMFIKAAGGSGLYLWSTRPCVARGEKVLRAARKNGQSSRSAPTGLEPVGLGCAIATCSDLLNLENSVSIMVWVSEPRGLKVSKAKFEIPLNDTLRVSVQLEDAEGKRFTACDAWKFDATLDDEGAAEPVFAMSSAHTVVGQTSDTISAEKAQGCFTILLTGQHAGKRVALTVAVKRLQQRVQRVFGAYEPLVLAPLPYWPVDSAAKRYHVAVVPGSSVSVTYQGGPQKYLNSAARYKVEKPLKYVNEMRLSNGTGVEVDKLAKGIYTALCRHASAENYTLRVRVGTRLPQELTDKYLEVIETQDVTFECALPDRIAMAPASEQRPDGHHELLTPEGVPVAKKDGNPKEKDGALRVLADQNVTLVIAAFTAPRADAAKGVRFANISSFAFKWQPLETKTPSSKGGAVLLHYEEEHAWMDHAVRANSSVIVQLEVEVKNWQISHETTIGSPTDIDFLKRAGRLKHTLDLEFVPGLKFNRSRYSLFARLGAEVRLLLDSELRSCSVKSGCFSISNFTVASANESVVASPRPLARLQERNLTVFVESLGSREGNASVMVIDDTVVGADHETAEVVVSRAYNVSVRASPQVELRQRLVVGGQAFDIHGDSFDTEQNVHMGFRLLEPLASSAILKRIGEERGAFKLKAKACGKETVQVSITNPTEKASCATAVVSQKQLVAVFDKLCCGTLEGERCSPYVITLVEGATGAVRCSRGPSTHRADEFDVIAGRSHATVDRRGLITGLSPGNATLHIVRRAKGVQSCADVKVVVRALASIRILSSVQRLDLISDGPCGGPCHTASNASLRIVPLFRDGASVVEGETSSLAGAPLKCAWSSWSSSKEQVVRVAEIQPPGFVRPSLRSAPSFAAHAVPLAHGRANVLVDCNYQPGGRARQKVTAQLRLSVFEQLRLLSPQRLLLPPKGSAQVITNQDAMLLADGSTARPSYRVIASDQKAPPVVSVDMQTGRVEALGAEGSALVQVAVNVAATADGAPEMQYAIVQVEVERVAKLSLALLAAGSNRTLNEVHVGSTARLDIVLSDNNGRPVYDKAAAEMYRPEDYEVRSSHPHVLDMAGFDPQDASLVRLRGVSAGVAVVRVGLKGAAEIYDALQVVVEQVILPRALRTLHIGGTVRNFTLRQGVGGKGGRWASSREDVLHVDEASGAGTAVKKGDTTVSYVCSAFSASSRVSVSDVVEVVLGGEDFRLSNVDGRQNVVCTSAAKCRQELPLTLYDSFHRPIVEDVDHKDGIFILQKLQPSCWFRSGCLTGERCAVSRFGSIHAAWSNASAPTACSELGGFCCVVDYTACAGAKCAKKPARIEVEVSIAVSGTDIVKARWLPFLEKFTTNDKAALLHGDTAVVVSFARGSCPSIEASVQPQHSQYITVERAEERDGERGVAFRLQLTSAGKNLDVKVPPMRLEFVCPTTQQREFVCAARAQMKYAQEKAVFTVGQVVENDLEMQPPPMGECRSLLSFEDLLEVSVTPALPTGLSLALRPKKTGAIYGVPAKPTASKTYTVMMVSRAGVSAETTVEILIAKDRSSSQQVLMFAIFAMFGGSVFVVSMAHGNVAQPHSDGSDGDDGDGDVQDDEDDGNQGNGRDFAPASPFHG